MELLQYLRFYSLIVDVIVVIMDSLPVLGQKMLNYKILTLTLTCIDIDIDMDIYIAIDIDIYIY